MHNMLVDGPDPAHLLEAKDALNGFNLLFPSPSTPARGGHDKGRSHLLIRYYCALRYILSYWHLHM